MPGKAYLVGAGPGNPGLITLRGREVLGLAEVLVYDAPCAAALLEMAPPGAERIPVGRWPGGALLQQAHINALLVERANRGQVVVRLKGGDPFVFGRGGDEALALAGAGIEFEIVPGVPAALGAAAWAGIPITQRGFASEATFAIFQTGAAPSDWGVDLDRLAAARGSLILYMDPAQLPAVAAELVRRGRASATEVAVVEAATLPEQRVYSGTLGDIAERAAEARVPAVVFVGDAVRLRERLAWAERRPLHGRCVVITRARAQSQEMVARLEGLGAEVLELPCIGIAPPESWEPLDRAIGSLERYDWAVFSSTNGVEKFVERLRALGRDARALAGVRIAAVGAATAEALGEANLVADAVPEEFHAEALAKALEATGVGGRRFLIVRAAEGREVLPDELRRLGAEVDVVPAYRTVPGQADVAPVRARAEAGRLSAVTFASPSAVRNFAALFAPGEAAALLARTAVAVIGPVTAKAVEALGVRVTVQPRESTAPALVDALARHFGKCTAD